MLALGRAALARIRANLAWALGYNLVAIPLAAGAALPAAGLALSPSAAGALMAFSSLAVVGNSLLLRGQARPAACSNWQTECACGRRRAGQRRAACCWRLGERLGRPQLGLQSPCYSRKRYNCYAHRHTRSTARLQSEGSAFRGLSATGSGSVAAC